MHYLLNLFISQVLTNSCILEYYFTCTIHIPLLIITAYHNWVYSANTAVSITGSKMLMRIEIASKTYPGRIEFSAGLDLL